MHYRTVVYVEEHLPVLGPLIQSPQVFSHYERIFLGDHIFAHFVSSANFEIFENTCINIIDEDYTKGAALKPTPVAPHLSHQSIPIMPLLFQPCLLSFNQISIHLSRFPPNPHASIFLPSLMWGTLSNAFAKSRYIR